MISKHQFRLKVAKLIIVSDVLLFALIIFLTLFTSSLSSLELTEILKVLIPIKVIYFTAIIKHAIQNSVVDKSEVDEQNELTPLYYLVARFAIYGHVISLIGAVILFVLSIIRSVDALQLIIGIIESLFGVYLGLIWSDLFSNNKVTKSKN
jgi:hypothetical protein